MSASIPSSPECAPASPWISRRAVVRYHCGPATPGRVQVSEKQEFLRAWVLDISRTGIGLLLNRMLEIGMSVIVQMKGRSDGPAYQLPASVARVVKANNGEDWIVGCSFSEPLSGDQLDDLL